MKSYIAEILIAGLLFTGMAFISCKSKDEKATDYNTLPTGTTSDGDASTTAVMQADTSGIVSDTLYPKNFNDSTNTIAR